MPSDCNLRGYPHRHHRLLRDAPGACPVHKWQDHGGWCYTCDMAFESDECHCAEDEERILSVLGNGPWPVGLSVCDIPADRLDRVARALMKQGKVMFIVRGTQAPVWELP